MTIEEKQRRQRDGYPAIGQETVPGSYSVGAAAPSAALPVAGQNVGSPQALRGQLPSPGSEGGAAPVGEEQLRKFMQVLQEYNSGLARTKQRIVQSEEWWKLRNTQQEQANTEIGKDGGYTSVSGWLHNVIVSKHADAMDSYPEANIRPREEGDKQEAKMLSSIIPAIMEQNHFEQTYSDAMWQKLKTGTGVYKVTWDASKLNGLGDISIDQVNLLNLFWEPGVKNIQKSQYFFHTELWDKELLHQKYPDLLDGKLKGQGFLSTRFLYDDTEKQDKSTVVEVYYHKNGKLHYCKFVEDVVLYATENNPDTAQRGLYDHGRYPYEFDALYPIEGSPCGYGFVDICRNPQTEIDLLKTAFTKNALVGATPRYFTRTDGSVNEEEFLDISNPIVHVTGTLDESAIRQIGHTSLDGNYISMLQANIQELRETSGNTETANGSTSAGVTAASAIAALQEASGKGSRDSTQASYRAHGRVVELVVELIRQFYDLPRQFRILGQFGAEEFVSYDNRGIKPQFQGNDFGVDMGYRVPAFDIKISSQKRSAYSKITQNEMALQFFQLGFFSPQMVDQALMCMDMMDFDGKDGIMQKIAEMGTMQQKLQQYMQMALGFATMLRDPVAVQEIQVDMAQTLGMAAAPAASAQPVNLEAGSSENTRVTNARQRSAEASQPGGSGVVASRGNAT